MKLCFFDGIDSFLKDSGSQFWIVVFVLFIVGLLITMTLTRWMHQIHKRNRLMVAQVKLLAALAEKMGVDAEFINGTIDKANKNALSWDYGKIKPEEIRIKV